MDLHVEVTYISAHTGHELGTGEITFLPLPVSTKESVAQKVSQGVTQQRILDGKVNKVWFKWSIMIMYIYRYKRKSRSRRHDFDQTVSRKDYLTKQDIRNISTKVTDNLVKKHR